MHKYFLALILPYMIAGKSFKGKNFSLQDDEYLDRHLKSYENLTDYFKPQEFESEYQRIFLGIPNRKIASEKQDRMVDAVALNIQLQAITRLEKLAKKNQFNPRNKNTLLSLLEAKYKASEVAFRVAHGNANLKNKAVDLNQYNLLLNSTIQTATYFISRYQNVTEVDEAYFLRAACYEHLNNISAAKIDYQIIVDRLPHSRFHTSSVMALGQFAFDEAHYQLSIDYYKMIISKPNNPSTYIALYKIAWSYFNLKEITEALSYLYKHYVLLKNKASQMKKEENLSFSLADRALLDRALTDIVTFYIEAIKAKVSGYSYGQAYDYFLKIEPNEGIGVMLLHFAKMLRILGDNIELKEWKGTVLEKKPSLPEAIQIINLCMEYFYNNKDLAEVRNNCLELQKIQNLHNKKNAFSNTLNVLILISSNLQKQVVKLNSQQLQNKTYKEWVETLAELYRTFIKISPRDHEQLALVYFNLGETLLQIEHFEEATQAYRTLYNEWNKMQTKTNILDKQKIAQRAIQARFQTLFLQKIIPEKITAFELYRKCPAKKLDNITIEWMTWVNTYVKENKNIKNDLIDFLFEVSRIYYANCYFDEALQNLETLVLNYPSSPQALAATTLIIDTYNVSKMWSKIVEKTDLFYPLFKKNINKNQTNTEWTSFLKKMQIIAAESFYNLIEESYKQKNISLTTERLDTFFKKYPKNNRIPNGLLLAAQIKIESKENKKAYEYLNNLLEDPQTNGAFFSSAYLMKGRLAEEELNFDLAVKTYTEYMNLKGQDTATSQNQKKLIPYWLELRSLIDDRPPLDCTNTERWEHHENLCLKNAAFDQIEFPRNKDINVKIFKQALKDASDEQISIFAFAILPSYEQEIPQKTLHLIRKAVKNFDSLEASDKYVITKVITEKLIPYLKQINHMINTLYPIRFNINNIKDRADNIRELEKAIQEILNLPLAHIKILALLELKQAYLSFIEGLNKLPSQSKKSEYQNTKEQVETLTSSIQKKIDHIHDQIFEVASKSEIDESMLQTLKDLPAFKKNLLPIDIEKNSEIKKYITNEKINTDFARKHLNFKNTEKEYAAWSKALEEGKLRLALLLMQKMKEKQKETQSFINILNAILLEAMHLHAEAITELESCFSSLEKSLKESVGKILITQYAKRSEWDKIKKIQKGFEK